MENKLIVDIIGWAGSVMVVVAYASVSYDKIKISPYTYQVLNAGGSLCLIINTFYYQAFPSATVNIIWLMIAFFALLKLKTKRA